MNYLQRSSYSTVVFLAVQSLHSSQSMTKNLLLMAEHASASETLTAKAGSDMALSQEALAKSKADQIAANTLQAHAAELQVDSEKQVTLANSDRAVAAEHKAKATEEEAQADAMTAEAAAEEATFQAESAKAAEETSEAAGETVKTEADGAATGICEFIPFLDLVCDLVGGVAGVGFEAHAAQLSGQAAIDAAAAAAAKSKEDTDLAGAEGLHSQAAEDTSVAGGFDTKANGESATAAEEQAQSVTEGEQAAALLTKSRGETLVAEEEAAASEAGGLATAKETGSSLGYGLAALRDAIFAIIFSFVSFLFFTIRFVVAVVIPGGAAIVGFIPYSITIARGRRLATSNEFVQNSWWSILPMREVSYFMLHCAVFASTMFSFSSKFAMLEHDDTQTRGGVILIFAVTAAFVQGALLHALPHVVNARSAAAQSTGSWSGTACKSTLTLVRVVLCLVPVFAMEAVQLWLLFGRCVFTTVSPNIIKLCLLWVIVFTAGTSHVRAFELMKDDATKKDNCECPNAVNIPNAKPTDASEEGLSRETAPLLPQEPETDSLLSQEPETLPLLLQQPEIVSLLTHEDGATFSNESASLLSHREEIITYDGKSCDLEMCHSSGSGTNEKNVVSYHVAEGIETSCSGVDEEMYLLASVDKSSRMSPSFIFENESVKRALSRNVVSSVAEGGVVAVSESDPAKKSEPIVFRYITDLKLPFELLIMTCMFVLLRNSAPILFQLVPKVLESHPHFAIECGAVLLVVAVVVWCVSSKNNHHGHIGAWTGNLQTMG